MMRLWCRPFTDCFLQMTSFGDALLLQLFYRHRIILDSYSSNFMYLQTIHQLYHCTRQWIRLCKMHFLNMKVSKMLISPYHPKKMLRLVSLVYICYASNSTKFFMHNFKKKFHVVAKCSTISTFSWNQAPKDEKEAAQKRSYPATFFPVLFVFFNS